MNQITRTDDLTQLVIQAQAGNGPARRAAFDRLAEHFQPVMYRHALGHLGDAHLAEDAVQEALLVAYTRIDQLRQPAAIAGWLRRIVITQCDRLTRSPQPPSEPIDAHWELAISEPSPETQLEADQIRQRVHSAIEALPAGEQDVTRAFYLNEMPQREIAAVLGLPLDTVKKRLQYARQHLRAFILAFDTALAEMVLPPGSQPVLQPVPIRDRPPAPRYSDYES
jgi:RNA polymerase sigma factor (sigma-70 family)